jgi:hypothetical protein
MDSEFEGFEKRVENIALTSNAAWKTLHQMLLSGQLVFADVVSTNY